jgi:hypothetical protein
MKRIVVLWLACGLALAQTPSVGIIDYYGVHKVPAAKLLQALGLRQGDPLPGSRSQLEERLGRVDGVVRARVEAVCCEGKNAILFVGIEERGAPRFEPRDPPKSGLVLPEDLSESYAAYLDSYGASARAQATDPELASLQERVGTLVKAHSKELGEVLRNSANAGQRAAAAHLIAIAPDKAAAARDLQYALLDADDDVRRNALRALAALAAFSVKHPEAEIRIAATWPVEMLNSMALDDRVGAMDLLLNLSDSRDPAVLALLRERAIASLAEMARWNSLAHALPAYILLGRAARVPEQEIQDSWSNGERDTRIPSFERAAKPAR